MIEPICTLRRFTFGRFMVVWEAMPERISLREYFGGKDEEIIHDIEGGDAVWFAVRCRVVHKLSGATLGTEWMGCNLRSDPRDFIDEPASYAPSMAQSAVREARRAIADLRRDSSFGLTGMAENLDRVTEILDGLRTAEEIEPYTEGFWWTEPGGDGSTHVLGPDPANGKPAMIAPFEMEEDAKYVVQLHNAMVHASD